MGLGLLILSLIIGHWSLNIAAVFLVLQMAVFSVFLARRAIVCSHGRQPNGMKLRISIRGNGYMEIHGIYMGSFVSCVFVD